MQDEKDGWIYWLGFFASHGRLQFHGSDGNTAADCCNRFQKRFWEMGGTSDSRPPHERKITIG